MALDDKIENTADELGGKAKDAVGGLTDDNSLQAEGKIDEATANVKQGAEKVKDTASDFVAAASSSSGPIAWLHKIGLKSEYAYIGGFASIGLSLGTWFISRNKAGDDKGQSDRWGIFIGHWAPTFMALGVALKLEED